MCEASTCPSVHSSDPVYLPNIILHCQSIPPSRSGAHPSCPWARGRSSGRASSTQDRHTETYCAAIHPSVWAVRKRMSREGTEHCPTAWTRVQPLEAFVGCDLWIFHDCLGFLLLYPDTFNKIVAACDSSWYTFTNMMSRKDGPRSSWVYFLNRPGCTLVISLVILQRLCSNTTNAASFSPNSS